MACGPYPEGIWNAITQSTRCAPWITWGYANALFHVMWVGALFFCQCYQVRTIYVNVYILPTDLRVFLLLIGLLVHQTFRVQIVKFCVCSHGTLCCQASCELNMISDECDLESVIVLHYYSLKFAKCRL